ncbi:hypothetical protein ERJ75_000572200 [Trypanosoma vivax]|nr:hypothetical protein ERJ75_000572200 [Trypanosoma vivax]
MAFLKELFERESPATYALDEPEPLLTRAVKRRRLPTALDAAFLPYAAAKLIGERSARAMGKRIQRAASLSREICLNVPLRYVRMG